MTIAIAGKHAQLRWLPYGKCHRGAGRVTDPDAPLVRFDGRAVAALNIGVQPEQVSAKAMIADYLALLLKEATALEERLA
jgi:hypothetical protein